MSVFTDKKSKQIGLGCMGITAFYGAAMTDDAALTLLTGVHNAGYTFFDTAEIYRSDFPQPPSADSKWNEKVLASFLATVERSSVSVCTKYMPMRGPSQDLKTVTAALDASLERLGTDYVDVYYLHRMPDNGLEGLLQWMESVKVLVGQGKVRNIGLSEVNGAWLRQAHAVHPVACVQQEWSLLTRSAEPSLIPVCAELGIAVVAYSPLARNLLAEVKAIPQDWRASLPRYSGDNFTRNQALNAQITALAQAKNATTAQLSLAWLYHQAEKMGVKLVAIPGTTKLSHATSNKASLDISLSDEEMEALSKLGGAVQGQRGDARYMSRGIETQKSN